MKKFIMTGVALSFAAALNASTALADITIATVGPITQRLFIQLEITSYNVNSSMLIILKSISRNLYIKPVYIK